MLAQRRSSSVGPGDGHDPPHALVLRVGERADRLVLVGGGRHVRGRRFRPSETSFRGRKVLGGRFGGRSFFCVFSGRAAGCDLVFASVIC